MYFKSRRLLSVKFFVVICSLSQLLIFPNETECCLKTAGKEAGIEASVQLSRVIEGTSDKLLVAVKDGVEAAKNIVLETRGSIAELAKSVDVRLNSGDLENIGEVAARHLKDALIDLSDKWNVAVNTADMKDFGFSAAFYLGKAIQNAKAHVTLRVEVDEGVVTSVKYISITTGLAFIVLFCALVVCLGMKCKCCYWWNESQNHSLSQQYVGKLNGHGNNQAGGELIYVSRPLVTRTK